MAPFSQYDRTEPTVSINTSDNKNGKMVPSTTCSNLLSGSCETPRFPCMSEVATTNKKNLYINNDVSALSKNNDMSQPGEALAVFSNTNHCKSAKRGEALAFHPNINNHLNKNTLNINSNSIETGDALATSTMSDIDVNFLFSFSDSKRSQITPIVLNKNSHENHYNLDMPSNNENHDNLDIPSNNEITSLIQTMTLCNEVEEHSAGELIKKCRNCDSLHFADEPKNKDNFFKSCCHFGKIQPTVRRVFPQYLRSILSDTKHKDYKNFKQNIRSYNSALAFASMGANVQQFTKGPNFFKIHGQVYHNIITLIRLLEMREDILSFMLLMRMKQTIFV